MMVENSSCRGGLYARLKSGPSGSLGGAEPRPYDMNIYLKGKKDKASFQRNAGMERLAGARSNDRSGGYCRGDAGAPVAPLSPALLSARCRLPEAFAVSMKWLTYACNVTYCLSLTFIISNAHSKTREAPLFLHLIGSEPSPSWAKSMELVHPKLALHSLNPFQTRCGPLAFRFLRPGDHSPL